MAWAIAGVMLCGLTAQAGEWETDFAKASAAAKAGQKYMLLDFSGSDWCIWCIRLEKEVFSTKDFQQYAAKNLVCVLLDFPHAKTLSAELKQQNADLAEKYQIKGYPTVILLNPDGKLVGETGYQEGGGKKYVEHLQGIIDTYQKKSATAAKSN